MWLCGRKLGQASKCSQALQNAWATINKLEGFMTKLYYEAHVTIEPVFDERRERAKELSKHYGFKLADLLMKKRKHDTEERSSKDTFMTGHDIHYESIKERACNLIMQLKANGFTVWRYKIEDTICDSRIEDVFNLLGGSNAND